MRVKSIQISNYKNIEYVELKDIPDFIVLTGPNGVGKSSILEAISYWKETLATYGPYEHGPSFFTTEIKSNIVSNNRDESQIIIDIEFAEDEIKFLKEKENIDCPKNFKSFLNVKKGGDQLTHTSNNYLTTLLRKYDRTTNPELGIFNYIRAERPLNTKIHSSLDNKNYKEEKDIRFAPIEVRYPYIKKKIINLIKDQDYQSKKLLEKIKNVFDDLMYKKTLEINNNGFEDLMIKSPQGLIKVDQLSSGEKSIFFTLSELIIIQPNNSIILFDEPDSHLHEEIQKKLIYNLSNLGKNNQIWISTHSTAIMNSTNYNSLFRMRYPSNNVNQILPIFTSKDKLEAFKSVAGSLAQITIGEKIIFIEGNNDSVDFCVFQKWFGNLYPGLKFIPSESVKNIVSMEKISILLSKSIEEFVEFYCIRDGDFENILDKGVPIKSNQKLHVLNRYSIENYLIDIELLYKYFTEKLGNNCPFFDVKDCNIKVLELIESEKEYFVNKMIAYQLNKNKIAFTSKDNSKQSLIETIEKYRNDINENYNEIKIIDEVKKKQQFFDNIIQNGKWAEVLPGKYLIYKIVNKFGKNKIQVNDLLDFLIEEIKKLGIPIEIQNIINKINDH